MSEAKIRISEVFGPTIQGEGALIGRPTVFVRTGGCDYRCAWCDTLYAVLPEFRGDWTPMSAEQVLACVWELSGGHPILVTLSGGNPALQPLEELLDLGHARGCTFALETQGSAAKAWFAKLDYLVLSPKPPSSGMTTNWDVLGDCFCLARGEKAFASTCSEAKAPEIGFKIVVFDEADYQFAREVYARFPDEKFVLQVGNPEPEQPQVWDNNTQHGALQTTAKIEWLLERVASDGWYEVSILPQLHVMLWGNKRGV